MDIIYFNGDFLPFEKATVSVYDRGFLFGDAVYEVIPVFDGHPFELVAHIERLNRSLEAVEIHVPLSNKQWLEICNGLTEKNHLNHSTFIFYLHITRGVETTRRHTISKKTKPTILASCMQGQFFTKEERFKGFKAITLEDSRRRDCYIKETSLLPSVLLANKAFVQDALEAILIRNGTVTEGAVSNVFIVKNNEIYTPALSPYILSGITRAVTLKVARSIDIACHEKTIPMQMLKDADEIWVTASSREICPIVELNEKPVADGKVGPIAKKVIEAYEEYKLAF
ncbi:MAG: aminotransferase class IV [Alphaproteobacteria bacterium]|nr:aminotransferase class IV [Alphaproteobacteria bacterium]